MPVSPMVPWMVVLVIMVAFAAVIFVVGQLVGHLFPAFREVAGEDAQVDVIDRDKLDIAHGYFTGIAGAA